jgi:hypothetical protein
VDLQKKTVTGLEPTTPVTIETVTETMISFSGQEFGSKGLAWTLYGTLDKNNWFARFKFEQARGPEERTFVRPELQAITTNVLTTPLRGRLRSLSARDMLTGNNHQLCT